MTTIDDQTAVISRMPGDVVCLLSDDGTVRHVSSSVERTLGLTAEEFASASLVGLIHPDDFEECVHHWRQVRDNHGEQALWEARIRHGRGPSVR